VGVSANMNSRKMNKLISPGSNDTPSINFDPETGVLFLGGSSLPENVLEVYKPVSDWLDEYTKNPNPETEINFAFEYLNTASSHMLMQIMEKVLALKEKCRQLKINWYYDVGDHDMRDFGEELSELAHMDINLVQKDYSI
jgi:hypothetical protein